MRARLCALILVLGALALPAEAAAQGLGDTAARERDRRAKKAAAQKKEPAPVFTNDDLGEGPDASASGKGNAAGAATPAVPSESPPQRRSDDRGERPSQEQPYVNAVNAAQNHVNGVETRIRQLGDKLNPMSGSFIYGPTGSNNANEEAQVRAELTRAEAELNQARQDLASAQQALADFRRGRAPGPPDAR